jgi:hypothetical protein
MNFDLEEKQKSEQVRVYSSHLKFLYIIWQTATTWLLGEISKYSLTYSW